MKEQNMHTRSLLLAATMVLGIASLTDRAYCVTITGSTAARAVVNATLAYPGAVFDSAPTIVYQGGATLSEATYVSFSGTINGTDAEVDCHWTGSESGIADLANGTYEYFLDTSRASTTTDGSAPGPFVYSWVELAMADNAKNYSKNPTASITGAKVGIVPFEWVAEKGSAAALMAVTDQNIQTALAGGTKLPLFTGVSSDTTHVYVSGRDSNSGTRVNAFGTCGYGIFSAPGQLQINPDGSMVDQGGGAYVGDYGYSGGSELATQMGYDLSQATSRDVAPLGDGVSHFSVIAYLGVSDATAAVAQGARVLAYNGVSCSLTAIEEGQYNFWGNEYLYKLNSGLSDSAAVAYTRMTGANGIIAHCDDVVLINPNHMHCTRNGPTTNPIHN